jgi:hypothetical protein
VWVNNVGASDGSLARAPLFDTVDSPSGDRLVHMELLGQDWYLVRRDPGDLNTGGHTCTGCKHCTSTFTRSRSVCQHLGSKARPFTEIPCRMFLSMCAV